MASGVVQTEAKALLEASMGVTPYTAAATPKVALMTATGNGSSGGTEVTGGSYARVALGAGSATTAVPSVIANASAISFTGMPSATVTGIAIFDTTTSTRRLWWGDLTGTSKVVGAGDTLSFAIGAITISL